MLGEFSIKQRGIRQCCLELEATEQELKAMKNDIENVYDNLSLSGSGTSGVKSKLKEEYESLKSHSRKIHEMKEVLEDILRLYILVESKMSINLKELGNKDEYIRDFFGDILDDVHNYFEDKKDVHKANKENVILRINDNNTRGGFSDDYSNVLQEIYEEVPKKYKDTKDLYDKHSENVVVKDFNSVNKNGKSNPYHSNGNLYLNTSADLSNNRGNGTTYYHEYGHYVVYKEGWIESDKCKGEFARFETSLKKEVSEYIEKFEQSFKEDGMEKGKRDSDLNDYIINETTKAIKKDINGSSLEYYHINNGISDIIDGVSNGDYEPSYGHPDGYWDNNQSRVANEAFAQFFSAHMMGDTEEIEKMKELMPETYKIYTNLVKNANN